MDVCAEDLLDSVLRVTGPRVVLSGIRDADIREDIVRFVNAGGFPFQGRDPRITFEGDSCYQGGDVIGTEETIREGGDYPSVYQTARYGNFCYIFNGLSPGEYFVDLHFAEIVNTNGPKGIRVFDVYLQDEKVLSELDVYAVVGANKPLGVVDFRVTLVENSTVIVKFEGNRGIPAVSAICIRRAPQLQVPFLTFEHRICNKCATEMEVSPTTIRAPSMKVITKYEKTIEELTLQCNLKSDECYEAWMSLASANEQLERTTLELDNKYFQIDNLEQSLEKQMEKLRDVSGRYEHDRKLWVSAISDLEQKLKAIKQEHSQLREDAHECANSIPDLNRMIFSVQSLVAQSEELRMKYSEELAKRKKLFNQLQETKGNIRVFCRCRPLSKEDMSSGYGTVVDFEAASDGDLGLITNTGPTKKIFKFDRVYTPKDDQSHVYADASPMVTSVLDGYNVCIFAYGQTGTGKTFTMEGTEQNRGVNYRTLEELFRIAADRKETFTYSISVSVLEVYNEQIRDLLATSPSSKKLEVRQAAEGFHHVPGIVEAKVENIKEVWDVLQAGSNARAVGSNNINEHSSRSHCMLCIVVTANNLMNGDCTKSKLWLVDLAGSERLAKTDAQGDRLKEAQNINRSLSALGDVISALASKSSHIPYRNSKLTHLLQDSLGGDSKALMFVQISPSENDLAETLSSLNFASRVRGIELGPARKQVDTGELQKTKQMLDRVRQECRNKDDSLRKLEESCQNLENKIRGKDQVCRSLQDKNKELEGQFELKKMELLKGKEEACIMLQQKVKEVECKLKERSHSESVAEQKVKELEFKLMEKNQSESLNKNKIQELELKLREQAHFKFLAEQKAKELEEKCQFEMVLKQKLEEMLRELRKQKDEQVKELEFQIKERLESESMLEKKVKELEAKLREAREQSDSMLLLNSAGINATPIYRRPPRGDETMTEADPQILRNSNATNKTAVSNSLLRGTEPFHEMKRKRDRSLSGGEHENNALLTAEKSESQRTRKLDQAKVPVRTNRTPKVNSQRILPLSRTIKELAGGLKDRTRGWH